MFKGLSTHLKRYKPKYIKSVYQSERPVTRSRVRLLLGGLYFTWRRYFQWFFVSSTQYATTFQTSQLPFKVVDHGTPLYRRLRNVDIWLQENKVTNLKLATAKINGLVLKPEETISI